MLSKNDVFLEDWLQEFKSPSTRRVYKTSLNKFKDAIGIEDLAEYVKDSPDVAADMRKLLASLEGKPSKTIKTYSGAVKVFLQDKGVKISDDSWKKLRRRGYLPKRVKAQTQDKKPTKTQLKRILNYVNVIGKALILFLLSSGARIGETLLLREEDLNLDADPPSALIRGETTKGGVGERTVYFSYEARDAIQDWICIKDGMGKRDGSTYESEKVFPFTIYTAIKIWNLATDKAKLGIKDKRTGRRIYHLHSLRKFFRTKIGLDLDVTNALMGHSEYLDDAYLRLDEKGDIAEAYKGAMPNISVYEIQNSEVREQTRSIEEDNRKLKDEVNKMKTEMRNMQSMMKQILNKLPQGV